MSLEQRRGDLWGSFSRHENEKIWVLQSIAAAVPPVVLGIGITSLAASLMLAHTPGRSLHIGDLSTPWIAFLLLGLAIESAIVAGLLIVGVLQAIKHRWAWGFSWIGYGLMQLFLLVILFAEDREFLIAPWVDGIILASMLIIGAGAMLKAILEGWQTAGLMGLAFSSTLSLSMCFWVIASPFNRFDLALLGAPIGILMGWLVWQYMRGDLRSQLAILCGVGLINIGLVYMAEWIWLSWEPYRDGESLFWPVIVITTALLVGGPLLGSIFSAFRRWKHAHF